MQQSIKKYIILFSIASLLFLIFIFYSYLVHKNLFVQFDFDMTVRLQDHLSRRLDGPFSYFSIIGSFEIATLILVLLLVVLRRLRGFWVLFLFLSIHLFELYGKLFVTQTGTPFMFHITEDLFY
jgi:hypothetical protein